MWKSSIKPLVAPEEAVCTLIICHQWCHSVALLHCGLCRCSFWKRRTSECDEGGVTPEGIVFSCQTFSNLSVLQNNLYLSNDTVDHSKGSQVRLLTWSDQCLTSHRCIVSTWQTLNTCRERSYMRAALFLHLETNCPAGFNNGRWVVSLWQK